MDYGTAVTLTTFVGIPVTLLAFALVAIALEGFIDAKKRSRK